jgi:hypothetical protein
MRIGAAAVAAVVAAVLAGCGGSGSERLSRDAFVSKADAACRDLSARQQTLTPPTSIDAIPAYADKAVPILDDALNALRGLRPPSELADGVDSWLNQLAGTRSVLEDLRSAAEDGDEAKVRTVGAKGTDLDRRAKALAQGIGLIDCANL